MRGQVRVSRRLAALGVLSVAALGVERLVARGESHHFAGPAPAARVRDVRVSASIPDAVASACGTPFEQVGPPDGGHVTAHDLGVTGGLPLI